MDRHRRESLALLDPTPGERLLIVGAGTGADLPHLPAGCTVLATDLTPAMLRRARQARERTHLAIMDGHRLAVPDGAFDGVVLHLVLAVIPDPARCLREAARALRPGGRVVVFDKFVRTRRPPLALRALNVVIRVLFTDMTRRFEDVLERSGADLVVVRDEPAFAGGLYRRLLLRRGDPPGIAAGAFPPLPRRP
ncbi:MAG TPA: class I SAM-dependent methyltransferase [Vicinamibacteria bacterium]|nr:class I SAM-dependent methyltransferase [Vicinamibacteria bacterium]